MKIYSCDEWGARPPSKPITAAGRPRRIIFHHTAGHAPTSTLAGAKAYARSVQAFHMDSNGWIDSGHNFLVCRDGTVLEGRHGSVDAVKSGKMVVSAHCPGENDQPGVEHEHLGDEKMTAEQIAASVALHTWVCKSTGIKPTQIFPHRQYFATDCPGSLTAFILPLRDAVAAALKPKKPPADHAAYLIWQQWAYGEGEYVNFGPFEGARPNVVDPVPDKWYRDAIAFLIRNRHP